MKVRVMEVCALEYKKVSDAIEFVEYIKSFIERSKLYYKLKEEGKDEEAQSFYENVQEQNKAIANELRAIMGIEGHLMRYGFDEENDVIVIEIFEKHELLTVGNTYGYGIDDEGTYIEVEDINDEN